MEKVIEVLKLDHSFEQGQVSLNILNNINLTFKQGEFVALLGNSGSGKSILFNLIAGFMKPTSGVIKVLGTDITKLKERLSFFRANRISVIFRSDNLIPSLTAFENIALPLKIDRKNKNNDKVNRALEIVGLKSKANCYPVKLSTGEQQRIAIARALVTDPQIILADALTSDLELDDRMEILNLLKEINNKHNMTLFIVTDDDIIAEGANRIIHLQKGSLHVGKDIS